MISQKARYAFKALILLASQPAGTTLQIDSMARGGGIPRKFLEQILLELKARRLIDSRRGRAGGYFLVKPAAEIMVGEVLRAIDGPIAPLSCLSRTAYRRCADCRDEGSCGLRRLLADAYAATMRVMDATSLAKGVPELPPLPKKEAVSGADLPPPP